MPNVKQLGFTPLINGRSTPYVMDLDGRNKRDVSGKDAGFAYGYSAAPDGQSISYHENYQIYIANIDGSGKRHIPTGNPFDFAPRWSADSQWLMFVSGMRGKSNPYLVRRDGTGLRQLADLGGYQGWILFLDVPDSAAVDLAVAMHGGSQLRLQQGQSQDIKDVQTDQQ